MQCSGLQNARFQLCQFMLSFFIFNLLLKKNYFPPIFQGLTLLKHFLERYLAQLRSYISLKVARLINECNHQSVVCISVCLIDGFSLLLYLRVLTRKLHMALQASNQKSSMMAVALTDQKLHNVTAGAIYCGSPRTTYMGEDFLSETNSQQTIQVDPYKP